jgi:HAD superfamily hydrolase (TIGR01509 family)
MNSEKRITDRAQKNMIKLAIFDMDGTVFDSRLDWQQIRKELKINPGESILSSIYKDNSTDEERLAILERYERENTMQAGPIKGVSDFLTYLKGQGTVAVLVTNNNRENTDYLLKKYKLDFHQVITREQKIWKPGPDAFLHVMTRYRSKPSETISIGDSHYDVKASRAARLSRIYIITGSESVQTHTEEPGIVYFHDYEQLKQLIHVDTST